jgi:N-methylhydantoinase B
MASDIGFQVMWNRLLAVVEEQAQTLVRTAFSTPAREAGDISAGVFDLRGRMVAQAVTGTPGHVNTMAAAVPHFLAAYPLDTMSEGDVFVTNDPWKGTGHLSDFTVVTPAYRNGRAVALFACTTHVVDIGGLGQSPDGRQVYHEGLWIPICRMFLRGEANDTFFAILRQNVREPVQVEGDMYALAACNEIGARRLVEMMDEHGLDDLSPLSDYIVERSREAMIASLATLPKGSASYSLTMDGYDKPITLHAKLTVSDTGVVVDFDGTSGISEFGINCPKNYCDAYTAFGVKCIVGPSIPNNAGSLSTIRIEAPEGCIVNAKAPSPVMARAIIGHMLPDVAFGCLHQIMPGRVPAEGSASLWSVKLGAGPGIATGASRDGKASTFNITSFHSGGVGARPTLDGLSATPFPSGVRMVPIEITEAISPLVVWRKEYRQDSGGAGRFRGGLGQVMEIGSREDEPFAIFATFDRTQFAPRGCEGGQDGAIGSVSLKSGAKLRSKGRQTIPAGEVLVLEMPGGGGYGLASERDPARVRADLRAGFVSEEAVRADYGLKN